MEVIMSSPVQECPGMENDRGDGAGKLCRSQRKNRKLNKERLNASLELSDKREDTGNPESKPKVPCQNIDIITQSSVQDSLNTGLGTTSTVDEKRMLSSTAATGHGKSSISKREEYIEIATGEKGSSRTTAIDLKTRSGREEYMEIANDKRGSSRNAILDAKTLQKREEHTKIANGKICCSNKTATCDTTSAVSKREKHMKIANGIGSSGTAIVDANTGSKREEYMETANGKTVSGRTAVKTVSKGEDHTKVTNGEMGSSTTTNLNAKSTLPKNQKSRRAKPTLGDILNPEYLKNMENVNGETGSGPATTNNTTSKKRKRQKSKTKNPASGDILDIRESTQEMVIAEKGSSTTEVLEAISNDPKRKDCLKIDNVDECPRSTAALDAKSTMLKSLGCTEIVNGEMGSSRTTTIDENMGSSGIATLDVKAVSRREEYIKIANGETGLRTTATCDAKSIVSERERHTKNVAGETASTNITTVDAKSGSRGEEYMKNANGETGSGTTTTNNTASKKRKRQKLKSKNPVSESDQYMKISYGESDSSRATTIDVKSISILEGCTEVFNDETGLSTTTTLIAKSTAPQIGKRPKPTIGDILNPRYLEIADTNRKLLKRMKNEKRKQNKKKKKALDLNTRDNTGDKATGKITNVATSGKKLLIFDVNGLLAHIVSPRPKDCKADIYLPKRAIFKRPFLDDFLCFCFERFHVGIWSSRTKKILDPVVNYLLGDKRKKLLFLWDGSSCTNSWIKTLENKHNNIVFKDLRKIWEKNGPGNCWVKGCFNESNTLLLDDSPYKALLNPKHTGIFPVSYSYTNTDDDFLGPKGDLRIYLEGVAAADNVKTYVEQHPFGQSAIDETSPHWGFYSRVLKGQKGHPC